MYMEGATSPVWYRPDRTVFMLASVVAPHLVTAGAGLEKHCRASKYSGYRRRERKGEKKGGGGGEGDRGR